MTSDVSVYNQVFRRICELRSRPQTSTNFWHFSLSFIFCNISYKQNIYSFVRLGVPSRPITCHHLHTTSRTAYVTRISNSSTSSYTHSLSYHRSPSISISFVFFSLTHKNQQHVLLVILASRPAHLPFTYIYSVRGYKISNCSLSHHNKVHYKKNMNVKECVFTLTYSVFHRSIRDLEAWPCSSKPTYKR
jgi:hypothetical protein